MGTLAKYCIMLHFIFDTSKYIMDHPDLTVSIYMGNSIGLKREKDVYYSKTCLKQPLKNRQNKDLNDKW